MPHVLTTCPYCGCGCGLYLQVDGRRVLGTAASAGHPVARGRLCAKGWHAHEVSSSSQRLRRPLIRRGEGLEEASWEEALGLVASRLGEIKTAGGAGAIGVLGSPRATNEENFLLSKLARSCFGTNNVDFSARLEALPGLFDLPKYRHLTLSAASLDDIERADLIVLWQADPAEEHPAAASRVLRAVGGGVPLIEVAARSGQLGRLAAIRLSPIPGTELQLAAGLLHVALSTAEPAGAEGDGLAASVDSCTPEHTETITGVPTEDIVRAGEMLAASARPLAVYSRGATLGPQGPEVLTTLAALCRVVSETSDSWSSLLWLSTYCNFQGARDMGVVPYFLSGYQAVSDQDVRDTFARAWGASLPTEPGLPSWEMLGTVRAMLVMGDDPTTSLPDAAAVREAVAGLEFLVVQEAFLTPVAQAAHVVLPSATFAEKDGTFTNTERRLQRVRKAVEPPGEARADWEILCEIARRFGRPMEYESPAQVMAEIASLTPIYSDVSYDRLDEGWGVRWSLDKAVAPDQALLGAAAAGEEPAAVEQSGAPGVDDDFPLILTADHALESWAADKLVVNAIGLRRQQGADRPPSLPQIAMNPADAESLDLRPGQRARVRCRNGGIEAAVRITDAVRQGVVVLPARLPESAAVLPSSTNPETGVPLLRPRAVCIEKV
ncbi:MAG: molybdopterin-dependent oxidoreductase [Armatimonadota bacterium]|nr:molybdopterin-dependent oxidoreductase [Armatimonadota bacterium]